MSRAARRVPRQQPRVALLAATAPRARDARSCSTRRRWGDEEKLGGEGFIPKGIRGSPASRARGGRVERAAGLPIADIA